MTATVTCTLCGMAVTLLASVAVADGPNLITNPGFEDGPVAWSLPEELYAVDDAVAHTGARSLRYRNLPGGPYLLAIQGLPLEAGRCYRMSVWVKTEGVVSAETGASICLEWTGPNGYLSGAYPPGVAGTGDWQLLVYETGPLPAEATGGHVVLYGRPGTSGSAWFDDVQVVEIPAPLATFRLAGRPVEARQANFWLGPVAQPIGLQAQLNSERDTRPEDYFLLARLSVGGQTKDLTSEAWQANVCELQVPPEALIPGDNGVELYLVSRAAGRPITGTYFSVVARQLVRLDLVAPNPAGVIGVTPGGGTDLTARINVAAREPGVRHSYRARLTLLSEGRDTGPSAEATVTDETPALVTLSLADAPSGLYDLQCDLFEGGEAEPIARTSALVTVADPSLRPSNATWLGPNRMLMVEDKPFFPIGFYILSSLESVFPADQPYRWLTGTLYPSYYLPILDRLAASHFNCFIDYGSTMGGLDQARDLLDAAHQRGLRAIFSVKDFMPGAYWEHYTANLPWRDLREATRNVVEQFRFHPSLLAWYINDEVYHPDLWQGAVNVFRDTRQADPWHPTYAVHYMFRALDTLCQACDVIGTDPYTLLSDIGFTASSWREGRRLIGPDRPFWAVVQCFGFGYETSSPTDTREPTYDEERAATFAAIAEGATGIIYYCYHSLERSPRFEERFAELDRIAAEVQTLVPILSLPDAPRPAVVESGDLSVLTKQDTNRTWLILASTRRTDQDVTLRLPFAPTAVRDRATGEALDCAGDRLSLPFRALDARVLELLP